MAEMESIEQEYEDEESVWTCPNCGSPMNRVTQSSVMVHVCEKCGTTIEGDEQDCDLGTPCPNCFQIMDGDECPYCGYDMGSDFT